MRAYIENKVETIGSTNSGACRTIAQFRVTLEPPGGNDESAYFDLHPYDCGQAALVTAGQWVKLTFTDAYDEPGRLLEKELSFDWASMREEQLKQRRQARQQSQNRVHRFALQSRHR